jgi:uncharacterized protein (DUF2336 family)
LVDIGTMTQVNELLALAHDKSTSARTRVAELVSDLFFDQHAVLSDRERSLMGDILRHLVHDVEVSIRRKLAERLASESAAPRELIAILANDDIEVAHPVLERSEVLQDQELIEIIHQRTLEHQLVIAMRKSVSANVSTALVETGNADVIEKLLENRDARISRATMDYLVEESKRIDRYQNPLLGRPDLPAELASRMYWWVSAALRTHILERFDLDPTALDEAITRTVESAIDDDAQVHKAAELARRLHDAKAIDSKLLVKSLRKGEVSLFEALFAQLVELPAQLVRRFIFEPGGESLAIASRAVDIDKGDFASIFLLSRAARPGEKLVDPTELSRVIAFYDRVRPDAARLVVRRWRLNPAYVDAIERVAPPQPAKTAVNSKS